MRKVSITSNNVKEVFATNVSVRTREVKYSKIRVKEVKEKQLILYKIF